MAQLATPRADASRAILAARQDIAEKVVALEFELYPDHAPRFGASGRERALQDALFHLAFLAQSLALDSSAFFAGYVAWVKIVLVRRGVSEKTLAEHLRCMSRVIQERIAADAGAAAAAEIDRVLDQLAGMPEDIPTFIDDTNANAALARGYLRDLVQGERRDATLRVRASLAAGLTLESLYLDVFAPTQRELGRLWQLNEINVAQEHFGSAATQFIMSQVSASIFEGSRGGRRVVAACVAGDQHEIGLRMVADFFEMAGWRSFYLGANMPHRGIVETVVATGADLLVISASIGFHVTAVRELIETLRAEPRCAGTRILVGGHPFNTNPGLWREIGADGHGADAKEAVARAEQIFAAAA
jgi:methanogenic corrinoid protein MtbC1